MSQISNPTNMEWLAFVTWTGPVGAGGELPPRPQRRRRRCVCLGDLGHAGKVLDLDPGLRVLPSRNLVLSSRNLVLPDDDLGDGDVGFDLDPLGVGVGLVGGGGNGVRVRLALQDNIGRAEAERY